MKALLRANIKALKAKMSDKEKQSLSAEIMSRLEQNDHFQKSSTIVLYYALNDEVQTTHFIDRWYKQKHILLPKVKSEELTLHPYTGQGSLSLGAFNIMEPNTPEYKNYDKIDLVITPAIAFDKDGNRLGRGKGFYDRFFEKLKDYNIYKIGVIFPCQLVEKVPTEDTDIPVDEVIY